MENPSTITTHQPLLHSEKALTQDLPPQVSLFKGQVVLNPTISKTNFFALLIYGIYLGIVLIPINLLQAPLLSITYHLSPASSANANSIVQISQLVVQLLAAPWIGYLCDRYGRKLLIIIGVVAVTISTALLPNLPTIYPYYILVLVLQCLGFLCLSIPPLIADYIDYETKGRVAGIMSVLSALGGYVSTFIEEDNDLKHDIDMKFYEFAVVAFVLGVVMCFTLKGGQYHKALRHDVKAENVKRSLRASGVKVYDAAISEDDLIENVDPSVYSEEESNKGIIRLPDSDEEILSETSSPTRQGAANIAYIETSLNNEVPGLGNNQIVVRSPQSKRSRRSEPRSGARVPGESHEEKPGFMAGLREAKNPWILIGYIGGFLFMADSLLLGFPLVTHIVSVTGDENSASQAYVLTNKQLLVGSISAIVLGFCADKYDKFKQMILYVICSMVAVVMLIFSPTPYNAMAYVAMVWIGLGNTGLIVFYGQLLSKYATPKYRASVLAVGSMSCCLGVATINLLGVYIGQYNTLYPFYLALGFLFLALCILIGIYITKRQIIKGM